MATTTAPAPAAASAERSSQLSASTFKRLHPLAYFNRFLPHSYRPDGRPLAASDPRAWRDVSVNLGSISTAHGSALVRLGETTVTCGIKAEVYEPSAYEPGQGCIVPNVDLPALCSPQYKPGPPSSEAQILSSQLYRVLSDPSVLPLESLSIEHGKAAWVLYIDLVCINYDGNALDACLLAAVAALRNTRLPVASWLEEHSQAVCSRTAPFTPLPLGPSLPFSSSFSIVESNTLLPDPSSFEDSLANASATVVVLQPWEGKGQARLLLAEQTGLGGLLASAGKDARGTAEVIRECAGLARERAKVLVELLKDSEEAQA